MRLCIVGDCFVPRNGVVRSTSPHSLNLIAAVPASRLMRVAYERKAGLALIGAEALVFKKIIVLLFYGIAALSVTFFLAVKKKVTKEKLSVAPASLNGCAVTSGVVSEPDDADLGRLTRFCAFKVL